MRDKKQQKRIKKEKATQIVLGCLRHTAFSVDQGYSSVGCSPAEPTSAYPDDIKIIPTIEFEPKSYPHFLGFR